MEWWNFPLNLVVGQNFWVVLIIALLISWVVTPFGLIFLAWLLESRKVKIDGQHQFRAFWPGDFFLGAGNALLIASATFMDPRELSFWDTWWIFRIVVLVGAAIAVAIWHNGEKKGYGELAINSPTKIYHDLVFFGPYIYVVVSFLAFDISAAINRPIMWLSLLSLLSIFVWLILVVRDGNASKELKQRRIDNAHPTRWQPIWVSRRLVRKQSPGL